MDLLFTPENIIVALGTIGAFLTIVAFGMPLLGSNNMRSRLKAVAARREELSAAKRKKYTNQPSSLRQQTGRSYVTYLVDKLRLINPADSVAMKHKLFGLLTAMYLFFLAKVEMGPSAKLIYSFAAAVIGFFLPQILIKNKIQNRQKAIQMALPDALDLLIICVDAGLSMEAALHRVAKELQYQGPELSEELGLATAELAFLTDRRQAMLNLSERTGLPAIKALVTAMVQAERYGTAIGVSLRVLSEEQRDERMSRAEQKAGALPAQLTVPMIVFFLPVLFVVLLGPAIIKVLDTI